MSEKPDCSIRGRPTDELCRGCGRPLDAAHGDLPCPGRGRVEIARAWTIDRWLPTGRTLGLLLLLLVLGSVIVIGSQLLARP